MPFADRLKALRKHEGLSQDELGAKIGIKASTISRWESLDTRDQPFVGYLPRIAEALRCTPEDLVCDEFPQVTFVRLAPSLRLCSLKQLQKFAEDLGLTLEEFLGAIEPKPSKTRDLKRVLTRA